MVISSIFHLSDIHIRAGDSARSREKEYLSVFEALFALVRENEAVVKGDIDALILQNPENMGYAAVKAMHEHLTGKSPAKTIDTGCVVMTKENAETPEVKALRPAAK